LGLRRVPRARGRGLEPRITGPEPVVLPITPPPNGRANTLAAASGLANPGVEVDEPPEADDAPDRDGHRLVAEVAERRLVRRELRLVERRGMVEPRLQYRGGATVVLRGTEHDDGLRRSQRVAPRCLPHLDERHRHVPDDQQDDEDADLDEAADHRRARAATSR